MNSQSDISTLFKLDPLPLWLTVALFFLGLLYEFLVRIPPPQKTKEVV